MAHQAQELRTRSLQLLQRRQILHGYHQRFDLPVRGTDRSGVDQSLHSTAVGDLQHDFLGAHRRGGAHLLRQQKFVQGNFPSVGTPVGNGRQKLLRGLAQPARTLDHPPCLPVEPQRMSGSGTEDHHPHRRSFDQCLQICSRLLLGPMGARVGDRRRRLRGEQHQGPVRPRW